MAQMNNKLPTHSIGLSLLVAFFFIAGVITFLNNQQTFRSITEVMETHNHIRSLESVLSTMKDAETGQRGYVLTGIESYLEPYNEAVKNIDTELLSISKWMNKNADQKTLLETIKQHVMNKSEELQRTIIKRRQEGFKPALAEVMTATGLREMDALREVIKAAIEKETQQRQQSVAKLHSIFQINNVSNILVTLIGIIMGCIVAFFVMRGARKSAFEKWLQDGQLGMNEALKGDKPVHTLGEDALSYLIRYTGGTVGTFYTTDGARFVRSATYGIKQLANVPEKIGSGEGLVGQVIKNKKHLLVNDVPDNYISFGSSLGNAKPAHLIIYPAITNGVVEGIFELGFVKPYDAEILILLEKIAEPLAHAIKSANYRVNLQNFAEETQRQSEEIQSQSEEVRSSNEELEEQTLLLRENQADMQKQQAELEQSNMQLEQQTRLFQDQRDELARANEVINLKAEELEKASQYKSDFLANMSHELRTPLNSSLILSKLLADNPQGNLTEQQAKFARTILASSQDLLNLINDILDLSKIEAGHMDVVPENVEIDEIVKTMESTFKPLAEQKGLSLTIRAAEKCPANIYADTRRLQQIIKNFLSNAIKFTSQGSVVLDIHSHFDDIAFSVRDTGIGISPENQVNIFEAFSQADGTISRKYGGTGLGLSISRHLAQLMGGSITLESVKDQGSCFTLVLPKNFVTTIKDDGQKAETIYIASAKPVAPKQDNLKPAAAKVAEKAVTFKQATILIAEDDPVQQQNIKDVLAPLNASMDAVVTTGECLQRLREKHYDCVILDLALKDVSAHKLFTAPEVAAGLQLPPVIIYTAMNLDLKQESDLRQYAQAIIVKSEKSPERLTEEVTHILKAAQTRKAASKHTGPVAKPTMAGKHVLIVEDDLRNIFALRTFLETEGVNISIAHNGLEAIKTLETISAANTSAVDLILMDVMMPEMDGFTATRKIREHMEWRKLPIIMLTAKVMKGDHERCINAGANDYMSKPIDTTKLLSLMRAWLPR